MSTTPTGPETPLAPDSLGRLRALGLHPRTEELYRLVLTHGGQPIDRLGEYGGWTLADVRRRVGDLVALRLIRVSAGTVTAEPPELALRELVQAEAARLVEAQTALSEVRMTIPDLIADFRAGQHGNPETGGLETVTRPESIKVMVDLMLRTGGEMVFLRPDQWVGDGARTLDELVVEQLASGRASRALYPVDVLDELPARVRARLEAGEQLRVLPHVDTRLVVFGTDAAVTTEHWGSPRGGRLVVRHRGLVHALRALFEALWDRAVVPPGLGPAAEDDERRQLVALMLQGAIDQQIARATGVSLRTVRRRVAAVLADLGATSRFGAGVEAARRGWL